MLNDFPPEGTTPLERWNRSWMRRLTHRYGHRATFIWLVAIGWIGQAVVIIAAESPPVEHLFHTHIPVWFRVSLWIVPAVVALTVSRTDAQWVAFVLLALGPTQRMVSYMVGAGLEFVEPHTLPLPLAHATAWEFIGRGLIWAFVIMVLWLISTWTDPPRITEDLEDVREVWT